MGCVCNMLRLPVALEKVILHQDDTDQLFAEGKTFFHLMTTMSISSYTIRCICVMSPLFCVFF